MDSNPNRVYNALRRAERLLESRRSDEKLTGRDSSDSDNLGGLASPVGNDADQHLPGNGQPGRQTRNHSLGLNPPVTASMADVDSQAYQYAGSEPIEHDAHQGL